MLKVATRTLGNSPRAGVTQSPAPKDARQAAPRASFFSKTLVLGLAGSLLLWAAFPPLDLPWLAWIAPLPWLWLVRLPALAGWRPYLMLWLAGFLHWLVMLQGIRLAHPALYGGWIALAAYLGVYLPVFVGLSRVAVHRLRISLVVAAPVVWVGLEVLRGYLITGFSLGLLAHTQAEFPLLIQISDLGGGYTLSFVIMLVAACIARMIPLRSAASSPPDAESAVPAWKAAALWPIAPVVLALAATLAYGLWRLGQPITSEPGPAVRVALIQGSRDTVFHISRETVQETYEQYGSLTNEAVAENPDLDLVVWPESMFMIQESLVEEPLAIPPGYPHSAEQLREDLQARQEQFRHVLANESARANANTAADSKTMLLVGTTTAVYGPAPNPYKHYNTALLADPAGHVAGRYYKRHAVMFGEYIPLGDILPFIYGLTPMSGGMSVGERPEVFDIGGLQMNPNICFESTVPHFIRGQVKELARRGTPADVLVNISNDGWFYGTSILDLHYRCGIFRAVENRKPLLISANTGIAASIDGNGVVRESGRKRTPQVLIAEVRPDGRASPYHRLGDWPVWLCAVACGGLAAIGFRKRRSGPVLE
jgi:apolipoprotein N-acyltransferase